MVFAKPYKRAFYTAKNISFCIEWREGGKGLKRILAVVSAACVVFLAVTASLGEDAHADEEKKYIALTFDDGPWPETTEALLDGLAERDAKATFFLIGEQIEGMESIIKRMAEEGHQIGNHTYSHTRLDGAALKSALSELERTNDALIEVLGEGEYWIRPPWGFASKQLKESVTVPMIHWSVDTEDWKKLDANAVAEYILNHVKSGDIILMHDPYSTSVEAALHVVDVLSEQGYQFVTVQELFQEMGIEPEAGKFYTRPDTLRVG